MRVFRKGVWGEVVEARCFPVLNHDRSITRSIFTNEETESESLVSVIHSVRAYLGYLNDSKVHTLSSIS